MVIVWWARGEKFLTIFTLPWFTYDFFSFRSSWWCFFHNL